MDYQKIYKFPNGYGASVVCNFGTYGAKDGLFEVAVLDSDGQIAYNTPVASDVIGWLDFADVADILNKIKAL
jgi:UDP-N-acetylenolpyruvoylglucosamine reductase